jgi:parallel beta-helix repeat protein
MKKPIFALLVVTGLLFSLQFGVQTPTAQILTITIEANGSIIPSTVPIIQVNSNTYTFNGTIQGSLTVKKDNITIDGAGNTLQGSNGRGIILTGRTGVIIKNTQIILSSGYSIDLTSATNCSLQNNTVLGLTERSGVYAFNMLHSNGNTFEENTVSDCYNAFLIDTSNNNTLTQNHATNCVAGIRFLNSGGNVLRNNQLDNSDFSVQVYSTYRFDNDVDASNVVDLAPIIYWVGERDKVVPTDAGYLCLVNCTRITAKNLTPQGMTLVSTTNSTLSGISLSGIGGSGIDLLRCSGVNIVGCLVANRAIGLGLDSSSNNLITECTIIGCTTRGINFASSNSNIISRNNITSNGYAVAPFQDSTSSGNLFTENTFTGNDFALTSNGGGMTVISNNTFIDNDNAILWLSGPSQILGNTFRNNNQAIYISGSGNTLKNNRMTNNTKSLAVGGLLPSDYGSSNTVNVLVNDIDASNIVDGKPIIYWVNHHNEKVPDNAYCAILVSCNNITIQNLTIATNTQGIVLVSTTDSTVKGNTVTANDYGIGVFGGSQNILTENIITGNRVGMRIGDSTDNLVTNNSFVENVGFGIVFTGTQTKNILIRNNFINNQVGSGYLQVSIDKMYGLGLGNVWNDSNTGNYWSDYFTRYTNATEMGNTGTGNTLFYINENNIDYHPLVKPYNNQIMPSEQPTQSPTPTPILSPNLTITATPTSNPTPTPNPTSSPVPSPSVPEFPAWTVLPIAVVTAIGLLVYFSRRRAAVPSHEN